MQIASHHPNTICLRIAFYILIEPFKVYLDLTLSYISFPLGCLLESNLIFMGERHTA